MRISAVAPPLVLVAVLVAAMAPTDSMAQPEAASAPTVVIDASAIGEPISPYVYGQFIEHLGRCIYGGLWAEMLEDRKFYYPVTGEMPAWEMFRPGDSSWEGEGHPWELLARSPWAIVGSRDSVEMVTEGAFVGEHSPRIELPGDGSAAGLVQERLALERGRDYSGRIVVAGDASAEPLEVSLVWGGGASDRSTVVIEGLDRGFRTHPLSFTAHGTTDDGRLEITSRGSGRLTVGAVSLMPADNLFGWRADTVAAVRELDAPVYRWPGGNFVSGYDWRDGIGDRDLRPPRKNPAWKGVESNDVGLHEYMDLMRELGAEAFVAVNTGLGQADSAAEQVEYANGGIETPMGRLRAQHGHPQPFGIRFWAIGNEMYGDWQLGHMPLADYVEKHRQVVDAMRAVDPSIAPIAVGAVGEWSETMLGSAAEHMELISEHLYWQDEDDVAAHVGLAVAGIRRVADAHRGYREEIPGLRSRDIRIALDEWNYWYGPYEYGELGTRYFLQDALGIAAGLHEMFRNSDLFFMANYAQTVNVIGAVKTTKTQAELEPTGLVLALYRRRFGTLPVAVTGETGPLDVAAAWTEDRSALTVAVVNPTPEARTVTLDVRGPEPTGQGLRFVLTGADRWAHNAPGRPRGVDVTRRSLATGAAVVESAPLSVTLQRIEVR
ncbi:MAG TPA: alpha-L-arabinofuranosidase C-terminal domain-containing protein [Thermoanaerobaculia bacterium]|nr:alpha-L-arabinofuranosidase C-terminal domain-containing protein [Thermoanaerobaculia bacterium]